MVDGSTGAAVTVGRDRVRVAVWSSALAVCALLGFAGFIHEPDASVETRLSTGEFALRMGLFDQAREDLSSVLASDPDHEHAHLLMAIVTQRDGQYDRALAHYEAGRGLVLEADDPQLLSDYHVSTGLLRVRQGDYRGARRDADEIHRLGIRPAAGFLIRAFSRVGDGDDTEIRQALARAYSTDPFDPIFRLPREFLTEAIPWTTALMITGSPGSVPWHF